jgi:hypothetical protein
VDHQLDGNSGHGEMHLDYGRWHPVQAQSNSRGPVRVPQPLGAPEKHARSTEKHRNSHGTFRAWKLRDRPAKSRTTTHASRAHVGLQAGPAEEASIYDIQAAGA